ncbi:MAG: LamG-like jellyroll fold domain-containing protein, partial [Bacteroidia bacterium]
PQQQVVQGIVGVLYVNWIKTGHFMGAFDGTAGNNKSGDVSTSYVADGTWHHVASTNDGSKTRVFVDGNFESSYDEPLLTGVRDIQIGGGGWYFTGSMDDIRIYNYALQSTEIKAIHNGAKTSVIEDVTSGGSLNIYPNPANSSKQFNVEIPAAINNGSMTITTLPGRQVYTKSLKDLPKSSILPVDLKHFSSGIYMMNIISEKGISHAKFVIQ